MFWRMTRLREGIEQDVCDFCSDWAPGTERMLKDRQAKMDGALHTRPHSCPRCGGTSYMLSRVRLGPKQRNDRSIELWSDLRWSLVWSGITGFVVLLICLWAGWQ